MIASLMKRLFLFLSRRKRLCSFAMHNPLGRRFFSRFSAGTSLDDAVRAAYKLKQEGKVVIFDHLGENVHGRKDTSRAVNEYIHIIRRLAKENLDASVSIKLTQIGLDIGYEYCLSNAKKINTEAMKHRIGLEVDMESYKYVDDTLKICRELKKKNRGIVVALQSYLKRSFRDFRTVGRIRLVKGAYRENADVAYQRKRLVDRNYVRILLAKLPNVNVATHDAKIIRIAKEEMKKKSIPKKSVEFQMLYGIGRSIQDNLVKNGYFVRIYLPYGGQWCPYIMRRLAERPANVWFALKGLFK